MTDDRVTIERGMEPCGNAKVPSMCSVKRMLERLDHGTV